LDHSLLGSVEDSKIIADKSSIGQCNPDINQLGFLILYSAGQGVYKVIKLVGGKTTPLKNHGVRQLG